MKRNSFSELMYGVAFLIGMSSSSAFATCTSTRPTATTATVTCTSASDQVTFGQDTNGYWFHSGSSAFGTDTYDWDTTAGGEQFMTAGSNTITVNMGGGSLTIGGGSPAFSNTPQPADAMNGVVSWGGPIATVTFDSSASATANTYTVDDGTSPYPTTVNSLTFYDTSAANITILTGSAADTVNVLTVFGGDTVTTSNAGGADAVNIGKAGSVQGIGGAVVVTNAPNWSSVSINDSADTTARTPTISHNTGSGYGSITGFAPGTISWKASDISNVTVTTGTQADTVNVTSFASATGTLFVTSNGGADTVNIGGDATTGAQGVVSPVSVSNPPSFTTLNIKDNADTTGRTGTYTSVSPTGSLVGLAPGNISWVTNDLSAVNITNGSGADTLNVQSNVNALSIDGNSGVDTVNVGNATNGLQSISGSVHITNTYSYSNLVFDDSADTTARTATYDEPTSNGTLAGVAPITIGWDWANTVTLNMGTAADTVNVHSTYVPLTVQGTNGADSVNIGNASSTQSILGTVSVHNAANWSYVTVDDSADTTGRGGYVSATGVTGLTPAVGGVTWAQNDVRQIAIYFGSGDDTIHVTGSPASGVSGGAATYVFTGDGTNQMYIKGAGLGAYSNNYFVGGANNDYFDITSAVAVTQNVTSVNVYGAAPTTFPGDELDYFAAATRTGTTASGTIQPADPNAIVINYNSIEFFDFNDEIFKDGFQ